MRPRQQFHRLFVANALCAVARRRLISHRWLAVADPGAGKTLLLLPRQSVYNFTTGRSKSRVLRLFDVFLISNYRGI